MSFLKERESQTQHICTEPFRKKYVQLEDQSQPREQGACPSVLSEQRARKTTNTTPHIFPLTFIYNLSLHFDNPQDKLKSETALV